MFRPKNAKSKNWLVLGVIASSFFFVPLWDIYALIGLLCAGWRDAAARRTLVRLVGLALAAGLAFGGLGVAGKWLAQPGSFGLLASGFRRLPEKLTTQPCCDVSLALAPGQPSGALVWAAVPASFALLGIMVACVLVLSAALIVLQWSAERLALKRPVLGLVAKNALSFVMGGMSAPVGSAALLILLVLGVRFGLVPVALVDGAGAPGLWGLLWAGLTLALFPAANVVRAAMQRIVQPSPDLFGVVLAASLGFMRQSGWMLGGLLIIEPLFGISGVGSLLLDALIVGDAALIIRVLALLFPLLMLLRVKLVIAEQADAACCAEDVGTAAQEPQKEKDLWLPYALAGLLLVLSFLFVFRDGIAPRTASPVGEAIFPYALRSVENPAGTDHLGRDVQAVAQSMTLSLWGTALTGGLVAAAIGGLWGIISAWLKRQSNRGGDLLSVLVRVPAEALLMLHPALVVLLLQGVLRSPAIEAGQPVIAAGVLVGLVLAPRAALAADGLFAPGSDSRVLTGVPALKRLLTLFVLAAFTTMVYSLAVGILGEVCAWEGIPRFNAQELILGEALVGDGRFLRVAISSTLPGILGVWGVSLLLDTLPAAAQDALAQIMG